MSIRPGVQTDVIRILGAPVSHYDIIQEGPFATVARTWVTIKDGIPEWVVVKSATTQRKFAREPHDIAKELRLLSSMIHSNIVCVLGSFHDEDQSILSIYMPYLPMSLASLLASPRFSPHPFPPAHLSSSPLSRHHSSASATAPSKVSPIFQAMKFNVMARSIFVQTLEALAFLHDPLRSVGHRDIKPENVMLTKDGCVKLIDFGVAWKEKEKDLEKKDDFWPEYKGKLYFEVSTRAYRAPELLFGSRNYDHLAIDLWSLGVTFAEFFTSLRLRGDEDDDGDDDGDDDEADLDNDGNISPFIVPRYLRIGYPGAQWVRDSLFDGQRGEIGLAWSIFKILGTPNKFNWPDFTSLPGATSVVFKIVPSVPLRPLLANLPPSTLINPAILDLTHFPVKAETLPSSLSVLETGSSPLPGSSTDELDATSACSGSTSMSFISASEGEVKVPSVLDLLRRFLVYPAAARLRAEDALRHPWFVDRLDGKDESPAMDTNSDLSDVSSLSPPSAPVEIGQAVSESGKEGATRNDTSPAEKAGLSLQKESTAAKSSTKDECEEREVDIGSPILLLPPGYALECGPPDLKSISEYSWCSYSLETLLQEVVGDPPGGKA